jgi:prevent-host-death family protein
MDFRHGYAWLTDQKLAAILGENNLVFWESPMERIINVNELRATLPKIVESVRQGNQFVVRHRGRPAFRIVPIESEAPEVLPLKDDPLYHADAVGESSDGLSAADHDDILCTIFKM